MRVTELIRTPGGAEVPSPGSWRIPRSHVTVSYRARTGLIERVRAQAPSAVGTLYVPDDVEHLALVLKIGAAARFTAEEPGLGALLRNESASHVVLRVRGTPSARSTSALDRGRRMS
jgi:hypothetical protein